MGSHGPWAPAPPPQWAHGPAHAQMLRWLASEQHVLARGCLFVPARAGARGRASVCFSVIFLNPAAVAPKGCLPESFKLQWQQHFDEM